MSSYAALAETLCRMLASFSLQYGEKLRCLLWECPTVESSDGLDLAVEYCPGRDPLNVDSFTLSALDLVFPPPPRLIRASTAVSCV